MDRTGSDAAIATASSDAVSSERRETDGWGIADVRATCVRALTNVGVPDANAQLQVSLLIDAELKQVFSHGLLRLPRLVERILNGVADPRASGAHHWAGNILRVDGENGLGPVVAMSALEQAAARARDHGVATASIRNCNHLGMLAWYAEKVAAAGQILIGLTLSEALVHPWGGRRAMIGTNPIAIAVPAVPAPFVLDMATSVVSMGKVHDHANRGEPIPAGWALDAEGEPTTDADAAKAGALAPFGGAKGYALGLAFEVLVAGLTGSAIGRDITGTLDSDTVCNKGDVFIVMEPAGGAADVVGEYLAALRESPPQRAGHPVRVPGDRAHFGRSANERGRMSVLPSLWDQIEALAHAA